VAPLAVTLLAEIEVIVGGVVSAGVVEVVDVDRVEEAVGVVVCVVGVCPGDKV